MPIFLQEENRCLITGVFEFPGLIKSLLRSVHVSLDTKLCGHIISNFSYGNKYRLIYGAILGALLHSSCASN